MPLSSHTNGKRFHTKEREAWGEADPWVGSDRSNRFWGAGAQEATLESQTGYLRKPEERTLGAHRIDMLSVYEADMLHLIETLRSVYMYQTLGWCPLNM